MAATPTPIKSLRTSRHRRDLSRLSFDSGYNTVHISTPLNDHSELAAETGSMDNDKPAQAIPCIQVTDYGVEQDITDIMGEPEKLYESWSRRTSGEQSIRSVKSLASITQGPAVFGKVCDTSKIPKNKSSNSEVNNLFSGEISMVTTETLEMPPSGNIRGVDGVGNTICHSRSAKPVGPRSPNRTSSGDTSKQAFQGKQARSPVVTYHDPDEQVDSSHVVLGFQGSYSLDVDNACVADNKEQLFLFATLTPPHIPRPLDPIGPPVAVGASSPPDSIEASIEQSTTTSPSISLPNVAGHDSFSSLPYNTESPQHRYSLSERLRWIRRYEKSAPNVDAEDARRLAWKRKVRRIRRLPPVPAIREDPRPHALSEAEQLWRCYGPALEVCGYRLRPRYQVDWHPDDRAGPQPRKEREDYIPLQNNRFLDAVRVGDGCPVLIKLVEVGEIPGPERRVADRLSNWRDICDSHNRVVPFYDQLKLPNVKGGKPISALIMPLLRRYDDPDFETVGEAVGFIDQILRGLLFLHNKRIAHRDIHRDHIMMDPRPLYPQGYHPIEVNRSKDLRQRAKHMTRTERPCKYFFTGFSASQTFHINSGHVKMPYHAGKDATVPEHQYQAVGCLVDPFAVDVYCLGNFLRTDFLQTRRGFDFLHPLVDNMTTANPVTRPTMDQVIDQWQTISKHIPRKHLRKRCASRADAMISNMRKFVSYCKHKMFHLLQNIPPVPTPLY